MYYYPVSAVLTECLILSDVEQQDFYGYEISQTENKKSSRQHKKIRLPGRFLFFYMAHMNRIIRGKHKKTLIFPVFSGNSVFYSDSCLVVV